VKKNATDNPIITIWSIFISPVIAGIVYDIYINGYNSHVSSVLTTIGIIYIIVVIVLAIIDFSRKKIEIIHNKEMTKISVSMLEREIEKLRVENQFIIDVSNEEVKTKIITNMSDLDYHLRLYTINTLDSTPEMLKKHKGLLDMIEKGIETQRTYLKAIKFDYKKFFRKFQLESEEEEESISEPPSVSL